MDKGLILNELKKHLNLSTDAKLADFLGITPQNLSNWRARNRIDPELIYTKCEQINPSWLLTGEGSMLKEEGSPRILTKKYSIPFHADVKASAGLGVAPVIPNITNADGLNLSYLGNTETLRAFVVSGHSMSPTIDDGDVIVGKRINSKDGLRDGQVYIIVTTENQVYVKRVKGVMKNITLQSDNEEYDDINFEADLINELYLLELILTKPHRGRLWQVESISYKHKVEALKIEKEAQEKELRAMDIEIKAKDQELESQKEILMLQSQLIEELKKKKKKKVE
ncbi:hypothetical protein FUAX_41120 (plasmid) [Fulvitalea axinellae]|uniref:Phage repressor protein C, contains Cro/C1-type HTH and peptisase s24 domains n=1 Tax=Fulvitalea axinellae TaxID=1182444 RepID=A0AAU9DKA3_9BACT|nr:hypothetical protein FUAX_41120 [Fulvitalea axinellae]